jgi:hypothetical protein
MTRISQYKGSGTQVYRRTACNYSVRTCHDLARKFDPRHRLQQERRFSQLSIIDDVEQARQRVQILSKSLGSMRSVRSTLGVASTVTKFLTVTWPQLSGLTVKRLIK